MGVTFFNGVDSLIVYIEGVPVLGYFATKYADILSNTECDTIPTSDESENRVNCLYVDDHVCGSLVSDLVFRFVDVTILA